MKKERPDIWAGYDPKKVKEALRKSAGALRGVDRHALLEDIHAARKQASHGHPPDMGCPNQGRNEDNSQKSTLSIL